MICTPCVQILVVSNMSSSFIVRCYLGAPHLASVNCWLGVIIQLTIIDIHFGHISVLSWTWYTLWILENCRDVISIGSIVAHKLYFKILWSWGKILSLPIQCGRIPWRWVIIIWGMQGSSIISSTIYYNGDYPIIKWKYHGFLDIFLLCVLYSAGSGLMNVIRWDVAGYMMEERFSWWQMTVSVSFVVWLASG